MNIKSHLAILFTLVFLSGCGEVFTGYGGVLGEYDTIYNTNLCQKELIKEKISSNDDKLMWSELGGSLERNCKNYAQSNFYFDIAESLYKSEVDLENAGEYVLKAVGTTLTNDNAIDYQGNVYETIMVNTYKGLNFMSLKENQNARVEFNRALDRQRRAKDEFASKIQKEQAKLAKEDAKSYQTSQNKQTQDVIKNQYQNTIFSGFRAYPDFINPFATYMAALFYLSDKDYLKARDLLKESTAMQPRNQAIKADFKLVNKILKKQNKNTHIWLIYENGKSLMKDEFRLDIPLFIVSSKVLYTGIALPTLKEQSSSYDFLEINNKSTTIITDMDRVIKTEFKTKLPMIVTKAVVRTVAKTIAQAQASQENQAAGIVLAVFNAITNKADVRSWVSLPKNFQVARVVNKGTQVDITTNAKELIHSALVPKNKNAIFYVRSSVLGYQVVHEIIF